MADDTRAPSVPPFRIPEEHTEHRNTLRAEWHLDRAGWGVDLLGLIPTEHQAQALFLWSRLEIANEAHAQQLRDAWGITVEHAYEIGQKAAIGSLLAIAAPDPSAPPTILH